MLSGIDLARIQYTYYNIRNGTWVQLESHQNIVKWALQISSVIESCLFPLLKFKYSIKHFIHQYHLAA